MKNFLFVKINNFIIKFSLGEREKLQNFSMTNALFCVFMRFVFSFLSFFLYTLDCWPEKAIIYHKRERTGNFLRKSDFLWIFPYLITIKNAFSKWSWFRLSSLWMLSFPEVLSFFINNFLKAQFWWIWNYSFLIVFLEKILKFFSFSFPWWHKQKYSWCEILKRNFFSIFYTQKICDWFLAWIFMNFQNVSLFSLTR